MPNLFQRINAVRADCTYVQKDKSVDGKYRAVSHDQVVSVVRAAMVKHGVICAVSQESGAVLREWKTEKSNTVWMLYDGWYSVTFINADEPAEQHTLRVNAQAADNGDKAPGKAVTYATKTALLKMFTLETGEDDESRADVRERESATITAEQAAELNALVEETDTDVQRLLAAVAKSSKTEQAPSIDALPAVAYEFARTGLLTKRAQMQKGQQ
jgi:succinate dehydrogenase flavin-adding protein (antitoxin of CptAB toxin-antitoxin module)